MGRRCGRDVRRLAGAPQPFRPTAVRRAVIGVFDAAGRAGILPSTGRLRSSGQFAWRGRVALARWRGAGLSVQMQTRPAPERSKAAVGARTPHTHDAVPGLRTLRVRAPPKLSSSQLAHALAVICRSRRAVAALQAGQRRVKVRNQLGYRPVELGHLLRCDAGAQRGGRGDCDGGCGAAAARSAPVPASMRELACRATHPLLGQLPCCGGLSNAFCLFFALMGELPALEQAGDRVCGRGGAYGQPGGASDASGILARGRAPLRSTRGGAHSGGGGGRCALDRAR